MSSARLEVADSEDEEETLLLSSPLHEDVGAHVPRTTNSPDALPGHYGNNKPSTASTTQQLRSAHRHLAEAMTDSSASAPNKRRSTALDGSSTTPCGERRPKRLKTYSGGKHSATSCDGEEAAFAAFCADVSPPRLSGASGSFGDDMFKDHEPQVLFRDTGSTAPDNQSSLPGSHVRPNTQQATIAAAAAAAAAATTPADAAELPAQKDSSSFPWPRTLTQPEPANAESQAAAPEGDELLNSHPLVHTTAATTPVCEPVTTGSLSATGTLADLLNSGESVATTAKDLASEKPKSSPYVEVECRKRNLEVSASHHLDKIISKSKNRRTSSREDGLLDSDELIGLPKEMYKPRPTSRRATQISDTTIDYGEIPEKVAKKKAKRNKTVDTVASAGPIEPPLKDHLASKPSQSHQQDGDTKQNEHTRKRQDSEPTTEDLETTEKASKLQESTAVGEPVKKSECVKEKPCPQSDEDVTAEEPITTSTSPKPPSTQERRNDKDGFAIPMSVTRASGRARRCQTTIYEDHTEFRAVPKSPSLQQQQAIRKQALKDVRNEAGCRGKKTTSVVDSGDEEDELSTVSGEENSLVAEKAQEIPEEAPKRRGRGRLRERNGATVTATAVSAPIDDADVEAERVESPSAQPPPQEREENASDPAPLRSNGPDKSASTDHSQAQVPPPSTPAAHAGEELSHQTPASKQVDSAKPTATHSPIASLGGVKYRVGLSKRQRIPSLLRTRKPMQPRKTA